jgi:hypothetical protein
MLLQIYGFNPQIKHLEPKYDKIIHDKIQYSRKRHGYQIAHHHIPTENPFKKKQKSQTEQEHR